MVWSSKSKSAALLLQGCVATLNLRWLKLPKLLNYSACLLFGETELCRFENTRPGLLALFK